MPWLVVKRYLCLSSLLLRLCPHLGVARVQGLIDGAKLSLQCLHTMSQSLLARYSNAKNIP